MTTDTDRTDAIIRQNELLEEQNALLREQNKILRQTTPPASDEREIFIEDIDRDEMRSGFLVTSDRKRLWNVQIGLINEFARICKKHNLRWFAFYGTLLGAVRHGGVIPWDDDVDFVMFRPDYEKFKQVVEQEITPPYFLDAWYNYRLESEEYTPADKNLQLVTKEQEKNCPGWYPFWPIIRIRDSRTAFIQYLERPHINQGIWIDIFPLDPAPPFEEKKRQVNYGLVQELFIALAFPSRMKKALASGEKSLFPREMLENFLKLTHKERALYFDKFMLKNFFQSERIAEFRRSFITPQLLSICSMKDLTDITYLPFEKIELPVPVGYESVLTSLYGDWRKLVIYSPHAVDYSADISYKEYFAQSAFVE